MIIRKWKMPMTIRKRIRCRCVVHPANPSDSETANVSRLNPTPNSKTPSKPIRKSAKFYAKIAINSGFVNKRYDVTGFLNQFLPLHHGFQTGIGIQPTGDQPEAIGQLVSALRDGCRHNTLLGVTGSGKTFTMANVIAALNKPTLIMSHNKTLAAQLYGEFKNFFPENAVEYFVSYYDYYQPEAYLPTTDTFIEKDLSINEGIEKMRLSATSSLLSGRNDIVVVSSVSCIYGIGNPEDFHATSVELKVGDVISRNKLLYALVDALYTRSENDFRPATFRVNGDTVDIFAAYGEKCYRVVFFDNEIEMISLIDPVTGQRLESLERVIVYPANLFVTTRERVEQAIRMIQLDLGKQCEFFESIGKPTEARRLKQRVEYDLEMIKELGYCPGIENYSRYFDGVRRAVGPSA